jgi:hypothetical protein
LPRSGGWILKRKIPPFPYCDAMGCYPLFLCRDWASLREDIDELERDIVSLAVVTDPFGDYSEEHLQRCFPDVMFPYKNHLVVDLQRPRFEHVSRHHRRNAAKAFKLLDIRLRENPPEALAAWLSLYHELTRRHGIRGMRAFSRTSFAAQLRVPGLTAFEAVHGEEVVGMILWYLRDSIAYYHLGAFSEVGYRTCASFGLFSLALDHFASRGLRWLDLGAASGTKDAADGLTRFKQGWATGTRPAYFCGRILEPSAYQAMANAAGPPASIDYFPAYRRGEFN